MTIVGYVRVDYCRRPAVEIAEDIKKYANWSGICPGASTGVDTPSSDGPYGSTKFAIHGIFFDEVPNVWEVEHAGYLEDAGILVKETNGILGHRSVGRKACSERVAVDWVLTLADLSQLWYSP